jgi:4-hydroxybenzoyl-CoA reductase subunit alpha
MNAERPIIKRPKGKPTLVGERTPLIDGVEKASGAAKYPADLDATGALVGRIFRSPYGHAEIVNLDVEEARKIPGVVAIITGDDCDVTYGILPVAQNEYPMSRGKVRYRGEPVAAVAAIDDATAEAALRAIKMEVNELPIYDRSEDSRKPGAVLLHDDKPDNIERSVHHEFGDVASGFADADIVRKEVYDCAEVTHMHMDPHAGIAEWDEERGQLTQRSSTQVPYYVHLMLAQTMKLEKSRIRVIKPFIGGGFGARTETLNFELVLGLLARAAKSKVRMKLSREETFFTHRGRPRTKINLKIGMKNDGRFTACECEVEQSGGGYGGYGIVTILYAGALLNAIYDIPAVKYDGFRVYTNTPPCGAMRGHGTVDVRHAFETMLDKMAEELGIDALELRRRNYLDTPTTTINGIKVNSYGLPECVDWAEAASGWKDRRGTLPQGRGLGIACSHYVSGAAKPVHWTGEPHATVNLKLDYDAGVTVLTGASDIGQGSSTILAQVVGEVLGLGLDRITVIANDSRITPKDNGSYSSRVTFMVGNAALEAAENLQKVLIEAAARKMEAKPEDIECLGEIYRVAAKQGAEMSYEDVVREALIESGTITVKGNFTVPREYQGGKYHGAAVGPSMAYSYAAVAVEVDVDEITGRVNIEKIWVAHDCGYALNPLAVEGQVQGAVWMGLGQAVSEETRYHKGLLIGPNVLDYRVPTIKDSPDIEVKIVESMDPNGPFGAKEASEAPLAAVLPAVANAVYDAIGVRIDDMPLTPERIIDSIIKDERDNKRTAEAAE